jgi:V8-like Glu-specific endopeptidase
MGGPTGAAVPPIPYREHVLRKRAGGAPWRTTLACAALAVLAVGAWAPPASADDPITDGLARVAEDAASIKDYWTEDRMREAIPLGPVATGAKAAAKRRGANARRVRHVKRFPNRTHGKVFLTLGGIDYVCSGTSVDSPSKRLVWTAGHCVCDPTAGGCAFATNWEFVPAYHNGESPFGEWPANDLGAASQWRGSGTLGCGVLFTCGDVRYDLGAARVASNGNGRKLEQVVGARDIGFNLPRSQTYRGYGYPAQGRFNGERMWRCRSGHAGNDNSVGSPEPLRFKCDMTGGSSGGSWVVSGGRVASVVSYGYAGEPNNLYGPYQGSAAKSFYNAVKSG